MHTIPSALSTVCVMRPLLKVYLAACSADCRSPDQPQLVAQHVYGARGNFGGELLLACEHQRTHPLEARATISEMSSRRFLNAIFPWRWRRTSMQVVDEACQIFGLPVDDLPALATSFDPLGAAAHDFDGVRFAASGLRQLGQAWQGLVLALVGLPQFEIRPARSEISSGVAIKSMPAAQAHDAGRDEHPVEAPVLALYRFSTSR